MLKIFDPETSEYDAESPVFVLTRGHINEFLDAQGNPHLTEFEWEELDIALWERDYDFIGEAIDRIRQPLVRSA